MTASAQSRRRPARPPCRTLPSCAAVTNGSIARNNTGFYGCPDGVNWKQLDTAAPSTTDGYTLTGNSPVSLSPLDATNYSNGGNVLSSLNYDDVKIYVPKNGTIKSLFLKVNVAGTLGTGEQVNHTIIINNNTNTGRIPLTYTAAHNEGLNDSVETSVTRGDYLAVRIVAPTWVTNPTTVRYYWSMYIE